MTVQTIDVAPTPAQYVNVIRHLLTNVYPTEHQHLTRYQLITAWHAVERDARALYSDVGKLPRPLVVELAKLRVAQARRDPRSPHHRGDDLRRAQRPWTQRPNSRRSRRPASNRPPVRGLPAPSHSPGEILATQVTQVMRAMLTTYVILTTQVTQVMLATLATLRTLATLATHSRHATQVTH